MDALPEVYYLTTIDQAHVVSDPFRLRVLEYLIHEPLTVTQLGERLGGSPSKMHYHVRELQRIGLVRLVETRESERGGVLEKYYQAVAQNFQLAPNLLRSLPTDDADAMQHRWFQRVTLDGLAAATRTLAHPEPLALTSRFIWATDAEFGAALQQINAVLQPLQVPRSGEEMHEWSFSIIAHRSRPGDSERMSALSAITPPLPPPVTPSAPPTAPAAPSPPHPPPGAGGVPQLWLIGEAHITREQLERAIAAGAPLNVTIQGTCHVDDDVTPDLIERGIARFVHQGVLDASPAVREALEAKEIKR